MSGATCRFVLGGILSKKYWSGDLVKSAERVRDAGEVFTPFNIIEDMLDLLPDDSWAPHPSKTFLEPSCGNGRFLVVILYRKFDGLRPLLDSDISAESKASYMLEAVSSIYGVDISEDNILGQEGESKDGARSRVIEHLEHLASKYLTPHEVKALLESARWIVNHNILIGNMLDFDSNGEPTNRDEMPVLEYTWHPELGTVSVKNCAWGDVAESNRHTEDGMLDVFGDLDSESHWSGRTLEMQNAPKVEWKPKGIIARGAR